MNTIVKILILLLFITSCADSKRETPIGMSPYVFRHTSGWNAAKAIVKEDTTRLKEYLNRNPYLLYVKDPYYGHSLLSTAVMNNKLNSVRILLNHGFDPNFNDCANSIQTNPVIMAASSSNPVSTDVLKLLLEHGGNPNSKQKYRLSWDEDSLYLYNRHAISFAANNNLEKVKLLLEYGAEINPPEGESPICSATVMDNMDIVMYLLEHGADYRVSFEYPGYLRDSVFVRTLPEQLRNCLIPLDSKQYEYKMKIVEFLKERGMDYKSTEIPIYTLKRIQKIYPTTWQKYIKVY